MTLIGRPLNRASRAFHRQNIPSLVRLCCRERHLQFVVSVHLALIVLLELLRHKDEHMSELVLILRVFMKTRLTYNGSTKCDATHARNVPVYNRRTNSLNTRRREHWLVIPFWD